MEEQVYRKLLEAREQGRACALATVTEVRGSVPRAVGAKMLIYVDGTSSGTVGGGKFEALVIEGAREVLTDGKPATRAYPLHEAAPDSFGAICGGEVTVFIEPVATADRLFVVGAGHCGQALAQAARLLGYEIIVIDEREEVLAAPALKPATLVNQSPSEYFTDVAWRKTDAVVLVSHNHQEDLNALLAVLTVGEPAYLGMIGSVRKVRRVMETLREQGVPEEKIQSVYAPVGLDIGSDSPAEIAVAILAECMAVKRRAGAGHLRDRK